jgi:hypothetical protein
MKKIFNSILILSMTIALAGIYSSCEKDNNVGDPSIKYVRVTNPVSSDSLLVGAYQGNLIAIVGENLQDAAEIWFNDQKASLTPTYITSTTILVRIPSEIPKVITNILKIVFSDGRVLEYNFKVQISEPVVQGMINEYTLTGSVATIRGNYFYEPLSVTFAGGTKGEIVSVKEQAILVRIPQGAQAGQIIVKTNFGETKSNFMFRDNRPMFIDSDPYEGWWNASYVVSSPGATDPPKINGSYIRIKKTLGSWSWNELAGGPASSMPLHCKNVPDEAILKPSDYNLKFEVNTLKPYNGSVIKINVALNSEDNNAYQWKPPYDTKGQWETVIIPFEEIVASYAVKPVINPNGYWTRLLMHGPGDLDADICFDNFRVVPKVIK